MGWGFFKKVVIADRLAEYVNLVYNNPEGFSGINNIIATFFFSFQIYCDFSGYSDIAIGAAMVMGYDLMTNFRRPYFAENIREFWQRWHISLSTWFRDYVYISLGGNRVVKWRWYYNLFITFLVSGLWHGAEWTFVIWGAIHGIYMVIGTASARFRENVNRMMGITKLPRLYKFLQVLITFVLVYFSWIFFRANNLGEAIEVLKNHFVFGGTAQINLFRIQGDFYIAFISILVLLILDFGEERFSLSYRIRTLPIPVKTVLVIIFIAVVLMFGVWNEADFLYFQF
jgi:D-alanyl-lipoteichoic acid acyltransferase DltB (MBOAT superfamily)